MSSIRSPFDIREKELHQTRLECGTDPKDNDVLFHCFLESCDLVLIEPCHTRLNQCQFDTCTITAHKICQQSWSNCRWLHCKFLGDFESMTFGNRDDSFKLGPGSMLRYCDFSKANLDLCFLANAELDNIRFPKWPLVTILNPYDHRAELRAIDFSDVPLKVWWFGFTSYGRPADAAISSVTIHWEKLVERKKNPKYGGHDFEQYTELFRSTMERMPYVVM